MTSKVEAPKDYKALTKKYFTKLENDVYKCHCGKLLKRKDGTGWSNLMQHIRTRRAFGALEIGYSCPSKSSTLLNDSLSSLFLGKFSSILSEFMH